LAVSGILIVVGATELDNLYRRLGHHGLFPLIAAGGLLLLVSAYISNGDGLLSWFTPDMALVSILFAILLRELWQKQKRPLQRAAAAGLGALYLGLFAYLVWLRHLGPVPVLTAVLCTWCTDTAAYLTGMRFGRTPMAPAISPAKTREGALGGLLGGLLAGVLIACGAGGDLRQGALLGLVAAFAAEVGDLVESAMKREAGVKDAGNFFPGHGGVLDRFDSLLFAGAAVYYLWLFLE